MDYISSSNFIKATQFIYDNIDKSIELEDIAKHLAISVSSLKRLFQVAINQSPAFFIRRLRMKLAFLNLQSKNKTVLEVAMASSFEDHSAFSRAFKNAFGYSPTCARNKINLVHELENISLEEPEFVDLDNFEIQAVTEIGRYFDCAPKAWDMLSKKLTKHELSDSFSGIYIGFGIGNEHDGDLPDMMQYTAGISLTNTDLKIQHITLDGGKYARFKYVGMPNNLGLAYHYIYGKQAQLININLLKPAFQVFDGFPQNLTEQKIFINVPLK